MEFEDDETSTQEHQFRAEGTLEGDATRDLLCRDVQINRSSVVALNSDYSLVLNPIFFGGGGFCCRGTSTS